jgi:hypothetical protein
LSLLRSGWALKAAGVAAIIIVLSVASHRQPKRPVAAVIAPDDLKADTKRVFLSDDQAAASLEQLPKGKIKSILNITKPMTYGEFVWDDEGVPLGDIWIRVDLAAQLMSVFRGGHEIGTAVVMYGADEKPTPTGQFTVLWKRENHRSSLYDAEMPYTLRLTNDGVAIHGADVRVRAATHGCVSIPDTFAKRLFTQVAVGDPVTILPENPVPNPI